MSKSSINKIASGSFWGILAKVIDASAKFLTIPMLIGYFGKANYGLIALTFSLNAYLRLMELGMGTGIIRYFSMWLSKNEIDKITRVSQSSIMFYGAIGLFNALVFVIIGRFGIQLFNLEEGQNDVFQWMMYILAASSIFNWTSYVVTQLLTASEELGWINRMVIISSALNFLTAFVAVHYRLPLPLYFSLYVLSTIIVIPLNVYRLRKIRIPIRHLITPKWHLSAFKEVFTYSIAIFAMGIFQFSANNLRPLILGSFAPNGVEVLTEYRIIQTITMLVISFGGVFLQVLLPVSSKSFASGDKGKIELLVYSGTKYISLFLSLIIFILVINTNLLLKLYVGSEYSHLSVWLIVWLLTVLIYMHTSPIASLILSTGKTKPLVWSSAIACLVSIVFTILLAPIYSVGGAVIGYLFYILIQVSFNYSYYVPKILKLNSRKIFFGSFLPAVWVGALAAGVVGFINQYLYGLPEYIQLFLNTGLFVLIFGVLSVSFVVKLDELKKLGLRFAS